MLWAGWCAVMLIALVIRTRFPTGLVVEHFDEGVYASNLYAGPETGFTYPAQHLYAPPLVPTLIEWGLILAGPESLAPMWFSLLMAAVTCWGLGQLAREWFGTTSGWVAACLLIGSDLHSLLSRTALTDVPLGGWWVLTTWCLWRSIRESRTGWAVAAGIACGLGWWTKYNGWMPLAIAAVALGVWTWRIVETRERRWLAWRMWGLATVVASVVWSPWLWMLQEHGGYQVVLSNHRQYLVGLSGWISSFATQASHLWASMGGLTWLALGVAFACVAWRERFTWNAFFKTEENRLPEGVGPGDTRSVLALGRIWWASWFMGMTLLTPLYLPYARLLVPWLLASVLGLAWLIPQLVRRTGWRPAAVAGVGCGIVAILMLGISAGKNHGIPSPAWEHRDGVYQAVHEFRDQIDSEALAEKFPLSNALVLTYGEPAFHFHMSQFVATQPVSHLRFAEPGAPAPTHPTYLLVADHAQADPQFREQWRTAQRRLRLIYTARYRPSLVVRLDAVVRQGAAAPELISATLFRVK